LNSKSNLSFAWLSLDCKNDKFFLPDPLRFSLVANGQPSDSKRSAPTPCSVHTISVDFRPIASDKTRAPSSTRCNLSPLGRYAVGKGVKSALDSSKTILRVKSRLDPFDLSSSPTGQTKVTFICGYLCKSLSHSSLFFRLPLSHFPIPKSVLICADLCPILIMDLEVSIRPSAPAARNPKWPGFLFEQRPL